MILIFDLSGVFFNIELFWKNAKEYLKVENFENIRKIFFESYRPQTKTIELLKELRRNKINI